MNASFSFTATCSCANRNLLTSGLVCEICMGVVFHDTEEKSSDSFFEVDYFEALEEQLSKEDMAA